MELSKKSNVFICTNLHGIGVCFKLKYIVFMPIFGFDISGGEDNPMHWDKYE